jgi:hypothetical protein
MHRSQSEPPARRLRGLSASAGGQVRGSTARPRAPDTRVALTLLRRSEGEQRAATVMGPGTLLGVRWEYHVQAGR